MALFSRFRRKPKPRRVVLIGLDGTPHSLLTRMVRDGVMPNVAALIRNGSLRPMTSVYPWVSSVAWSSFMTGSNPAKHGIFGFIDRDPATLKTFIPIARHMKVPTLWDLLGQAGKRSVVINVPVTFPPRPINGVLISGFLSPKLEKAVHPASLLPALQELGYRIDTDPWLARESREKAMPDILDALEKRVRTMLHLMDNEEWDYFQCVIMETDRLHHFYFQQMEENDPVWAPAFFEVYRRIDQAIGEVTGRLGDNDTLMLMSDHGFCTIKREVFYNRWLADVGYLKYAETPAKKIEQMAPESLAYSMDPGRIFINLQGRERDGRVAPGAEYERLRDEIIQAAEELILPDTGEKPVLRAYRREELYNGPYLDRAADIILAPVDGYDPKGAFYKETLTYKDTMMVGMHTYNDAFLFAQGLDLPEKVNILDVMPTILAHVGVDVPAHVDGRALV